MTKPEKGTLEVGTFEGEVIVNHPDLDPDKNGVGHIVFSPAEARNLARILLKQADIAAGNQESAPSDLWEKLADELDNCVHRAYTATLTGLGDDIEAVANAIRYRESALAAERTRCIETALRMQIEYCDPFSGKTLPTVESVLAELERSKEGEIEHT